MSETIKQLVLRIIRGVGVCLEKLNIDENIKIRISLEGDRNNNPYTYLYGCIFWNMWCTRHGNIFTEENVSHIGTVVLIREENKYICGRKNYKFHYYNSIIIISVFTFLKMFGFYIHKSYDIKHKRRHQCLRARCDDCVRNDEKLFIFKCNFNSRKR